MTKEEIAEFLANRKAVGRRINPATAKVMMQRTIIDNEYGVLSDDSGCIGKVFYARAPGSEIWVAFRDLPEPVIDELWKRIECNDPDGPSFEDPDLPDARKLAVEIMARDDGEPGYARAVAQAISAELTISTRP